MFTIFVTWAVLAFQAAPPAQTPQPERGAELLTISFAAVGADGQPPADLKPGDVTIKIDGRERPIRSLQSIAAADALAVTPDVPALPPPFGSNSVSESGRTLMLAIDDESFKPGTEHVLRQAVDRLIAGLSPRDRVSLVTMPYGGVKVPATTEHTRLRTALLTVAGRSMSDQTGSDLACRTRLTLDALALHLNNLGVREAPSIVMLVTAGMAGPRRDSAPAMAPGMCELTLESFRFVGYAAGAARAHFYIVQPEDIMRMGERTIETIAGTGVRGSDNPVEGMEQLIGVTGGKLLNIGGGTSTAFDRILRENAAYYVATIEPQRSDRSGRSHQLDVRVGRPGVEARAARAITFPAEDSKSRPAAPSTREMLGVMTVFRDLPLRATAYSSFEPEGTQVKLITLAEAVDPAAKLASLVAALFDRDGKLVSSWVAQAPDLTRTPVIGAVMAPPGAYRLRVAAIDSTGRAGTADYDVLAEIAQSGPLKLSSIVLGLSRAGGFVPRLQFSNEPVAIGYVELTGATPGARVGATLELSRTANGPALVTVPLAIESPSAGRYVATGAVPIGALPPGDYIVRAMVALEGHPATRVVRTLRKVIVP
jgi:VWFA-related protein